MSLLIDLTKTVQGKPRAKVDATTKKERITKCNGCPNLWLGLNCKICYCFVSDKTNYKDEECPDGLWGKVK